MKIQMDTKASLLSDLEAMGARKRKSPPSPRTIHSTLKTVLQETVAQYPVDTRLPPIRDLGKQLGISLVTAQRIVTDLIADGILYSRPRAGVFVAERSPAGSHANNRPHTQGSAAPEPTIQAPGVFESAFTFGTGSQKKYQRLLWYRLIEQFSRKYPNTSPRLEFTKDPSARSGAIDAYERLDWNQDWAGDEKDLLNLRESAPESLARRSTPEGLIPLYHRSNFLFYNPELLERCEIEAPAYRTFAEQLDYLENAAPKLKAKGYDPKLFSVQQPITLLGSRHLELFFQLVYEPRVEPALRETFLNMTERVLRTCRSCQRAPGFNNPLAEETRQRFMKGKEIPFFLGHSVDYWRFTEEKPPFAIQAYPMLSSDNTIFLWPMVGAASRQSKSPAEVLRFLNFLISEDAQLAFTQMGAFGAVPTDNFVPQTAASPEWLAETLAKSRAMRLASPELFYLAINILNNELWHSLLDHVDVEQAVDEAIQLGRVFTLQSRQSPSPTAFRSQ